MNQSKLESKIEVFFNVLSGFLAAYLTYEFIVLNNAWLQESAFFVTSLFSIISVIRSYFWRRFFNDGLHRVAHKFVSNAF